MSDLLEQVDVECLGMRRNTFHHPRALCHREMFYQNLLQIKTQNSLIIQLRLSQCRFQLRSSPEFDKVVT